MSASSPIASHSFAFQLFIACCTVSTSHSMAMKTAYDLPIADAPTGDDAQSDSGAERIAPATSSSPTLAVTKMTDRKVTEMSNVFKKTTVSEEECLPYHSFGWLTHNLISTILEADVPTIHDSTTICFESYLIAGLGLPPNKFLSSIMNFLGRELVHFNLNVIAALSCFAMLCECWLGSHQIPAYSGISILWSDTPRMFILGSGCHFIVSAISNTSMPPSRAPGRTLRRSVFWWICMLNRSG
jgi:hypothetical protein